MWVKGRSIGEKMGDQSHGIEGELKTAPRKNDRHTAVVTAADPVTPDASFTGPFLTIDKHRCGY